MASAHSPLSAFSVCFRRILVLVTWFLLLMQVDAQSQPVNDSSYTPEDDRWQLYFFSSANIFQSGFGENNDRGYWSSWNATDKNMCNWLGVTCSVNLTVERLDLSGWSLGYLKSAFILSNLRDLRELDLSNNFLGRNNQSIDPQISYLSRLTRLDLSGNGFHGEIPFNISLCQNLEYLSLENNQLVGEIPSLAGLTKLQVLRLADNFLTGPFPKELGQLNKLVVIDLSDNHLNGAIPSLPNSTKLLELKLDRNDFTGFGGANFPGTASLEQLSVSGNHLEGSIPSSIGELKYLKVLNMSSNLLSGAIPDFPMQAKAEDLQSFSVDLSQNQLVGTIPPSLISLSQTLLTLNLSRNLLEGSINVSEGFSGFHVKYELLDFSNNNLSGLVPSLFASNGTFLRRLSLQNNRFSGDIVDLLIAGITFGTTVEMRLGNNSFSGDLSRISNPDHENFTSVLEVLDISNNNLRLNALSAKLPDPLGDLLEFIMSNGSLREFYAGGNNFSGSFLPGYVSNPQQLEVLDLSSSHLKGQISDSAFSSTWLPNLWSLNLSNNDVTGPLPASIVDLPNLQVLDVANNDLSGQLPDIPHDSRLYNPDFYASNKGLCGDPLRPCPQGDPLEWWVFFIIAVAVVIALGSLLVTARRLRVYRKRHEQDADLIKTLMERDSAALMSLRDLRKATNNFADCIGEGGFGTVYRGELNDGTRVAIKRSKREGSDSDKQQFLNEVRILSQVRHRNLVRLLGCCMENKIALLIFEYISNGTLQEHLEGKFGPVRLTWNQRLSIAAQTADALHYLHSAATFPIYHRDVKSANILLDDDLNAKVADFGISRLAPVRATHVSTLAIQGTIGYLDPEYYTSLQLSDRSDVYSFGVVLLELISAKAAIDSQRGGDEVGLVIFASRRIQSGDMQSLLDPALMETYNDPTGHGKMSISKMAELAVRCVDMRSKARPSMNEVWKELQTLCLELNGKSKQLSSIIEDPQLDQMVFQYDSLSGPLATDSGDNIEMLPRAWKSSYDHS